MRSYEKANPEKPVIDHLKGLGTKVEDVSSVSMSIIDAGNNYKKEEGVLPPKSFFVIVSGGEVRERDYFKIISTQDRFRRIKIEFVADPNNLNPDGLLETAIYKQEHYKTSQEDEPDRIFIVSDVDHFMNDLLRIRPICGKHGIKLIISNSCFEIWLYYGKFSEQPTDFSIPENYLKISSAFKNYLGGKVKGGVNPKYAIFDIQFAIQNARAIYQEDKNGIPLLFSTNMYLLAESLLPHIKDELSKLITENKDR
ncbi:hypothetical protein EZS27_012458 [termite gut metagenome]|uniref:RloB domain-containing protein n=1 Tax=termite gut metagenome TaxID=433724 RepID=A0A5J4S1G2_9ZZZZ